MKKSILIECIRIAKAKLELHPERCNFPHYSFIIQQNKIVEWATNIAFEPPVHYGYHKALGYKPKFHAEVHAYKKAKGILINDNFSIVNIRLGKDGDLKLSAPCEACHSLLSCLGCNKFYYSSPTGFLRQ